MIEFVRRRVTGLPIRLRLTLWYVLLLGLTFALLSGYLLFRIQQSLMNPIDLALQIAVSQSTTAVETDTGEPAFDDEVNLPNLPDFAAAKFVLRLLSPQGVVLDTIGETESAPFWQPQAPGYLTRTFPGEEEQWRMYSQPIYQANGELTGWVQASQSLESVTDTLQDLREQLFWGIPIVVLLAGIGGYFLADRALRPIDRIARTAQTIEAGDLSLRIEYRGPADEVGRLANTFDQMLARLQGAFARERRFTLDAAHELRTPLTALKGQIEVALNRPRQPAEYRNVLQDLATQVERLIRLSNALLFLSHPDQDRNGWEVARLDLKALLDAVIEEMRPLAKDKDLALTAEIRAGIPIYGDSDNLIRLFINLLDNAIKYTPPGGEIRIAAEPEPTRSPEQADAGGVEGVQILIHNSGPGIPAEHLPHLFERFYRVDDDRSRETGGAGLGLAIAQEIVRLHRGKIAVQSQAGQGVTFSVWLPCATISPSLRPTANFP
jgi:heavy metal sensor kinase